MPESLEIFNVRLTSAFGGAKLLSNAAEIEIQIAGNDAPVRFSSRSITFTEAETKKISITRGLLNGNRIGFIDDIASIQYRTIDGSAKQNIDYIHSEGVINFANLITTRTIDIEVLHDSTPELREEFTIELHSPSENVILSEPSILKVYIEKNGDPHGVIGFNTTHINNNTLILDEDSDISFKSRIMLSRSGGYYGNITVTWKLEGPNPEQVFKMYNGSVNFQDTITEASIELELFQDNVASEASSYILTLVTITGGAKFEVVGDKRLPLLDIIVKDSDNAYGVVSFDQMAPNIVMVSLLNST